jgi:hypothetical protein
MTDRLAELSDSVRWLLLLLSASAADVALHRTGPGHPPVSDDVSAASKPM